MFQKRLKPLDWARIQEREADSLAPTAEIPTSINPTFDMENISNHPFQHMHINARQVPISLLSLCRFFSASQLLVLFHCIRFRSDAQPPYLDSLSLVKPLQISSQIASRSIQPVYQSQIAPRAHRVPASNLSTDGRLTRLLTMMYPLVAQSTGLGRATR